MTEDEFKKGPKMEQKKSKSKGDMIAQKDWHLFCPPNVDIMIKEGDDLSKKNIPLNLIGNLKTEKVLKG